MRLPATAFSMTAVALGLLPAPAATTANPNSPKCPQSHCTGDGANSHARSHGQAPGANQSPRSVPGASSGQVTCREKRASHRSSSSHHQAGRTIGSATSWAALLKLMPPPPPPTCHWLVAKLAGSITHGCSSAPPPPKCFFPPLFLRK